MEKGFVMFRQGATAPNVHLSDLRLVKDAFTRIRVATAHKIKHAEEGPMDHEDRTDYERDVLMNYGGAIALMREVERLAGMRRGDLLSKQDANIYVPVAVRMVCNG